MKLFDLGTARRWMRVVGLLFSGVLAVGTSLPVFAQGVDLQHIISEAKKEGHLTIYSSESAAQVEASAADFQKRYGIQVEATRLVSGALTSRFAAELKSKRVVADVVSISNTPFYTDNPDWWLKLDESTLPGIDAYPKNAVGERYITVSQQGIVIAYNKDMVDEKDVPKSYRDLLDPKWSAPGTIVVADPRATQSGMSFFWAMIQRFGPDYYRNLMKQKPAIGPGAGPVAQLVGSGANAIGVGTFSNHVLGIQSTGAPIGYVYPTDLATGSDNQIAISADAPHPYAARLFAIYRMSREANEVLCKVGGSSSLIGSFPGCEPPAPADYVQTNYKIWKDQTWQKDNLPLLGLQPIK